MNCSKCGHQNPDNVLVCESCGYNFSESETPQPKAKTSKMAVFSLILAISSLLFFVFTGLPAMLYGLKSLKNIRKSDKKLKGESIAKAGIILPVPLMCIFFLLFQIWRIDAPPISNDYTIYDIKSASPEYNHTYELLSSITGFFDKSIAVSGRGFWGAEIGYINKLYSENENDLQTISQKIKEKAKEITTMWDNAEKDREILQKLNSFPEIADLSEPGFMIKRSMIINVENLVRLYRAYITLQSIEGNHDQALNELIMLDSVLRKMSLNARSIAIKLFCNSCFEIDCFLLNFMINNPDTPNEILFKIRDQIDSLSGEHTLLRNTLIFEYLTIRNELDKMVNVPKLKNSPNRPLKYNSTLRFFRNYFDKLIANDENRKINNKFKIWPSFFPNIPVKMNNINKIDSLYFRIYNPEGYALIELVVPALNKAVLTKTKLLIYSDLLKIVFNARLGEEVDLTARAYSDEYIIDIENKYILSPGPDSEIGTLDDIKLPINPEVLGFTD